MTEEQGSRRPIFIATLRAARLLPGCFVAHRSKTTAGILPLRFAHPVKISQQRHYREVPDRTWEELVEEHIVEPMALKSAGFGPQASLGKVATGWSTVNWWGCCPVQMGTWNPGTGVLGYRVQEQRKLTRSKENAFFSASVYL